MAGVTIYHNPGCSKCRGALAILERRGVPHRVVEYLSEPPDRSALERILTLLPDPPRALVRKDRRFTELGLDADDYLTQDAVIDLLLAHPELMERPVVVWKDRALIARPPEKLEELLESTSG